MLQTQATLLEQNLHAGKTVSVTGKTSTLRKHAGYINHSVTEARGFSHQHTQGKHCGGKDFRINAVRRFKIAHDVKKNKLKF